MNLFHFHDRFIICCNHILHVSYNLFLTTKCPSLFHSIVGSLDSHSELFLHWLIHAGYSKPSLFLLLWHSFAYHISHSIFFVKLLIRIFWFLLSSFYSIFKRIYHNRSSYIYYNNIFVIKTLVNIYPKRHNSWTYVSIFVILKAFLWTSNQA